MSLAVRAFRRCAHLLVVLLLFESPPAVAAGTPPADLVLADSSGSREAGEARLRALREAIAIHDRLYFEENAPIISDHAYDRLKQELQELERTWPELAAEADLAVPAATGGAAAHRQPMLSLDKAYSEADWERFHRRVERLLAPARPRYVIEPKYDGVAISVTYADGELLRAVTRGDGHRGTDVTELVRRLEQLPRFLAAADTPRTIELRGEIYVPLAAFAELNAERVLADAAPYASPRSAAAGMIQGDPSAAGIAVLEIVLFGVGACDPETSRPSSQQTLYAWLSDRGLPGPHCHQVANTAHEAWQIVGGLADARGRWAFPNDGVVVKVDAFEHQRLLGADASAPRWAIACKFAPPRATTVLRRVVPQIGRTGKITPVAEFDPVSLAGTTLRRAGLHHYGVVVGLDLHEGDTIVVEKAGEVIPQLAEVDSGKRIHGARPILIPAACPACGATLVGETVLLRCPRPDCPDQVLRRLEYFVSPQGMDLPGVGPAAIEALVANKTIVDAADFFLLGPEHHEALRSAGISDPDAFLNAFDALRTAPIHRILAALSVPGMGAVRARAVARAASDFGRVAELTPPALEAAGIRPAAAATLAGNFARPEWQAMFRKLHTAQVGSERGPATREPLPLAGWVVVFSGRLSGMSRAEATAHVEAAGGIVQTFISRRTTHLVTGDQPGEKLARARERGIEILDEAAFLRALSGK